MFHMTNQDATLLFSTLAMNYYLQSLFLKLSVLLIIVLVLYFVKKAYSKCKNELFNVATNLPTETQVKVVHTTSEVHIYFYSVKNISICF